MIQQTPTQQIPPCKIDVASYYSNYRGKLNESHSTVFSTTYSPNNGRYLLACTSLGIICIWDVLGDDDKTNSEKGSSDGEVNINANNRKSCFSKSYWEDKDVHSIRPILR